MLHLVQTYVPKLKQNGLSFRNFVICSYMLNVKISQVDKLFVNLLKLIPWNVCIPSEVGNDIT